MTHEKDNKEETAPVSCLLYFIQINKCPLTTHYSFVASKIFSILLLYRIKFTFFFTKNK